MPETKVTNRLIHETSPYLLQHAHNPVDWYPWGDRAEDKPILLSCGYSACHWCHVMERESFEDEEIAALMNQYFVNIKVDREERPDIDQIYQHAIQAITGQGGWPLTAFLDHAGRPFFGGTYFPPVPLYGRSSFPQVLEAVHKQWVERRELLFEAGTEMEKYLKPSPQTGAQPTDMPDKKLPQEALSNLLSYIDTKHGGFSRAPKFPNPTLLHLFFKVGRSHQQSDVIQHALFTLNQMARGGIYDQLGGGFHRYSTDEYWLVPHFEKMLYDNAQLLKVYAIGYQLTEDEAYQKIVEETAVYIRREMTAPEGGFYATQDADSEGVEGKFFIWDATEIKDVLNEAEVKVFSDYYGVTDEGNFEGKNILNRRNPRTPLSSDQERLLQQASQKLFAFREKRVKPFRDEKVIAGWNGLMIGAMAHIYQVFRNRADYDSARSAAEFCLTAMRPDGHNLLRIYKDGQAKIPGTLDDYTFLAQGLIDLYEADFNEAWLERSLELTETAIQKFSGGQGLYYVNEASAALIARPVSGGDQAIPSGVSAHADNLLRLSALTGRKDFRVEVEKILAAYSDEITGGFWSHAGLIASLDNYYQGFKEFTFISHEADLPEILLKLRRSFIPYRILVWSHNPSESLAGHPARELLEGRRPVGGKPTCYPCDNFNCLPPVTEWEELLPILSR